jgi:hypothetical protein
VLFVESLAALIAAAALEAVSVLSEALALNLAGLAGRGLFPLEPTAPFAG